MANLTVKLIGCFAVLIPILILAGTQAAGAQETSRPLAHFHHIGLNSTDPARAIDYYASRFNCEKAKFNGIDAVRAQDVWLLFTKVSTPPKYEIVTAIWHIGWGAEDMKEAYEKLLDSDTKFWQGLTALCDFMLDMSCGKGGSFAYIDGPDHAMIEVNSAKNNHFGHVDLHSMEPIETGEWYMKNFGITPPPGSPASPSHRPRFGKRGLQVGPSSGFTMDNIRFSIKPIQEVIQWYPQYWKDVDRVDFDSTEDYAIDHIAFSVDNLEQTLERLKRNGVSVMDQPRRREEHGMLSAFIKGPDHIRIELIEDLTRKE